MPEKIPENVYKTSDVLIIGVLREDIRGLTATMVGLAVLEKYGIAISRRLIYERLRVLVTENPELIGFDVIRTGKRMIPTKFFHHKHNRIC